MTIPYQKMKQHFKLGEYNNKEKWTDSKHGKDYAKSCKPTTQGPS